MSSTLTRQAAPARPALFAITWPILAELLLGLSVGLAGLWMASRMSDAASAAFSLANNLQAGFFILFRVIGMGVSVVITQNLGAGNRAAADVLPLAAPYLRALAVALALDAFNATMSSVMRAHPHARDTLLTMALMQLVHLALSLPLMQGWGPLPALGLVGFAWAAAASRLFGLAMHLLLWRWRLGLVPHGRDWWRVRWQRLGPMLQIGIPGAAENVAYRLALTVTVAVVARMGAAELATQGYTMQIMYFVLLFGLAVGFASEILVGHMVGAGQLHEANRLMGKSLRWGLAVSTSLALVAALTSRWTMRLFTHDPRIIDTASTLLWITVILEPGRTFNLVVINGLRAAGDARFPVMAGAASMLFVMAGGAWLLGERLGLGLAGVWIAYAADEWLRGLSMAARWYRRGWLPAARATHRRVQAARRVSA